MKTIVASSSSSVGRATAPVRRLYRYVVLDSLSIVRTHGLPALVRRRGWRFVVAILGYYLVRDTLLYVAVPLLVTHHFRP